MSLFNSLVSSSQRSGASCNGGAASCQSQGVKPRYETQETAEAFNLTVYLPGVAKDGLEITAENEQLRIAGRRAWKQPEGLTQLYRESFNAPYELVLEHDNAVDLEKIQAELTDGVLQVTLPKAEAAKPRKIAVS